MSAAPHTISDREHMARALQLAERGLYTADPNPCVGCIIVNDGKVVGEGWHQLAGEAHAEVNALAAAGKAAQGATAYVTLEPCCHAGRTGACTESLHAAGISRVVFAVDDPNPQVSGKGAEWLRQHGIEVSGDLLADQATDLNAGFWSRMQRKRPRVVSKLAASLDGRTALANGDSQWLTGEAARLDVQRLRARSSAVLTGVATVLADNPSLNVRAAEYADCKQPLRVILDSKLRTPPHAKTLSLPGKVLILTVSDAPDKAAALTAAGAEVVVIAAEQGRVSLSEALVLLAERELNNVLVEAGAVLNGSFLQQGLLDEVVVYQAAHVLGGDARGMFALAELEDMSQRPLLELNEVRRVGADLRLSYRVSPAQ